jgi:glycosyltransferase involved in cell wall biosynthesis
MKKVLMVCEAYEGGVFAYVTQLCNDMCSEFDVYLAYSKRSRLPENFKELLDDRVKLIEVKHFGHLSSISQDIKLIKELRRIEKDVQPDIIHLHSSIAGGIGRIAFNGKNNKVVYTPHGYAHVLMGGKYSLKCNCYRLAEKILGNSANCITLTCCESEDEEARKFAKRTAYVETGVNLKDLGDSLDSIVPEKNEKFTVYTLGRTCTQKQPWLFNEIAKAVPEARFVWIGGGELDRQLNASNLEHIAWKPRKEALALGKGADVFVLCSLGEAIAMSVIENMFMGKLMLVSNTMGNKSVIKDGVNGYLCDTVEDYARHIREAMKQYPQSLCDQAVSDVRNIYNTDVMAKKYVRFYNDVIKGKYN